MEQALLVLEAPSLPLRAELVALADAVAIAGARDPDSEGASKAHELSARLRARAFRLEHTDADGREALEQYAAAAKMVPKTPRACELDRARALLAGEVAADAAIAFRELYLAARKHHAALGSGSSPCLDDLDRLLSAADAYRPSGDALRSLEKDAERGMYAAIPVASQPAASGAPSPASSGESPASLVVAPAASSQPAGPTRLVGIDPYGGNDVSRVVLRLSDPALFKVGVLDADNPGAVSPRLFVDIEKATSRGIAKETAIGGPITKVRVGVQPGATRVVMDLAAGGLRRRVFYLPDPFRIVIDVASPRAPSAQAPGVRRVAIDAGHGGTDDGAVGPTGLKEKDVTLDIAHRVATLLSHELKLEAVLTRDDDSYIPLEGRTARANAFHADLFVSIHCNASEDGVARGASTYVLDRARNDGITALEARENLVKGPLPGAIDAAALFQTLSAGEVATRSRHFGELLQQSAMASLGERYADTKDQGVRSARFFVLAGTDMPAALFETAFISNPEDESRLAKADYRQKLADAVVNAVRAYKEGR